MDTDETLSFPYEGGCTCGAVRYRMTTKPMFVHCCHCRWCQRETGASFALNALMEADRVKLLKGEIAHVDTPSNSGKGQKIVRCPRCHVALWSHYPQAGPALAFVRAGTLTDPGACPPDVHIFTSTKLPWVTVPQGAKVFEEFYDVSAVWPAEALARAAAARG